MKLNKVQFDSMAFQERNGTCGMKPERFGWNLAEKSGTNFRFVSFFELVWNVSAISNGTEWN